MDKRSKIIIGIFILVVFGIIITEIIRPRPLNWRPSYTAEDKIPFGCYVLYNELPSIFDNSSIEKIDKTIYDQLVNEDSTKTSSYLLINNSIFVDEQETKLLLDYVGRGNTAFISTTDLGWELADTLNLHIASNYTFKEGTATLDLTHNQFKDKTFKLSRGIFNSHFVSVDSTSTTILGHITYDVSENLLEGQPSITVTKPNFVKMKFGKGHFFINSTPQAYSNYYMLKGNQDYVAHTFSYLKDTKAIYWDNYTKAGRVIIDSPLRFILGQSSLKWAYYLTILGILFFVLFRSKREQRIVPVIEPLKNSSVEFARVVGSLYHQNKDHTDLVQKKLNYFLAYLRFKYHIDTSVLNDKTIHILASKAGKEVQETKALVEYMITLKNKNSHTEQDSIELNKKITAFKQ